MATDHVVESFRNRLWPGYKTGEGLDPRSREPLKAGAAGRGQPRLTIASESFPRHVHGRQEEQMERAMAVVAIVHFAVIGLSHVVQPKGWVQFFILLRSKGEAGAFIDGLLYLSFAALIIGFHNVWSGIPTVLTVLGWALG